MPIKSLPNMLVKRLLVVILLAPWLIYFIYMGGWPFAMLIALMLGLGGWEYDRMFRLGGFSPARLILITGTALLPLARYFFDFPGSDALLALLVLVTMTVHLVRFERGEENPASHFAVTLSGLLYVGWLGTYLVSLRGLENGRWWLLLVLPTVWLADTGAFVIGRGFGKHKIAPRVSPQKSWEGFAGGILFAALGACGLAALWQLRAPDITPLRGLILGVVLAVFTPLGDFGESMLKRQFGLKDTSNILPGHGGILDRIDSWLWAGMIGYYLIAWLW